MNSFDIRKSDLINYRSITNLTEALIIRIRTRRTGPILICAMVFMIFLLPAGTSSQAAAMRAGSSRAVNSVSVRRAIVNVPVAGVHSKRATASERVTEVLLGDEFRVLEVRKDWTYGSIPSQKGYKGWIRSGYLIIPPDDRFFASRTFLQIRAKKTSVVTGNESIEVALCTRLPLISAAGDDYEVLLPDGRTGSVPVSSSVIEDERFGRDVTPEDIMYAAEFIGTDYRWGGITTSGIDCSGFVYIVYRVNGIYLKRDSYMQADEGDGIAFADLRAGDLVFFRTKAKKRISHVGIYIGDGNFIHASRSSNGVIISSLSEDAFKKGLAAARRILSRRDRA